MVQPATYQDVNARVTAVIVVVCGTQQLADEGYAARLWSSLTLPSAYAQSFSLVQAWKLSNHRMRLACRLTRSRCWRCTVNRASVWNSRSLSKPKVWLPCCDTSYALHFVLIKHCVHVLGFDTGHASLSCDDPHIGLQPWLFHNSVTRSVS